MTDENLPTGDTDEHGTKGERQHDAPPQETKTLLDTHSIQSQVDRVTQRQDASGATPTRLRGHRETTSSSHTGLLQAEDSRSGDQRDPTDAAGQHDPVATIVEICLQNARDVNRVDDVFVDENSSEEAVDFYFVIEAESLDRRLALVEAVNAARDVHPAWEITPRIIARETDPDLDQLPKSATRVEDLQHRRNSHAHRHRHAF
jgi:hypothetical protein